MIAHLVFNVPVDSHYDYLIPEHLRGLVRVGCRVQAVFARKKTVGVVIGLADRSPYDNLNVIIKVLDAFPALPPELLVLAKTFAGQNACSVGEAVFLFLPGYLRQSGRIKEADGGDGGAAAASFKGQPRSAFVFDRTVVERWNIIKPAVEDALAKGRGVLLLLPESSYLEDVLPRLTDLAGPKERVLLRQGTEKDECARWLSVRTGRARLVVGFLSAVFAPVRDLGLIVVLDEESRYYKNDQSPFYNARDVAHARSLLENARLLLVSSAPSVESWARVSAPSWDVQVLPALLPGVAFLDISNFKMKKGSLISPGLRVRLENIFKAGGKSLLYVPAAKGVAMVMEELKRFFPQAAVAGYEKESSRWPDAQMVVATQSVFRHRGKVVVDFISVLDIDYEFHKSDHRAAHGAYALVQYLRQMARQTLLLQTREAHSPQLHAIAQDSHEMFYTHEIKLRQEMGFPPFGVFAAMVLRSADPELACAEAKRLYDMLVELGHDGVNVMEPQQDRSAILRGKFRWRVMLHGAELAAVVILCREVSAKFRGKKDTILTVNIDP